MAAGARNEGTALAMAPTPVSAEQPEAKALRRSKRTDCGGAGAEYGRMAGCLFRTRRACVVGGYANAVSWTAHQQRGEGWTNWVRGRMLRLLWPTTVYVVVGEVVVTVARIADADKAALARAGWLAALHLWLLPVYLLLITRSRSTSCARKTRSDEAHDGFQKRSSPLRPRYFSSSSNGIATSASSGGPCPRTFPPGPGPFEARGFVLLAMGYHSQRWGS
ncbi:hypothetical protein GCM10009647_073990 [Streptomyces sanglieri]